jgi:hypothetical protein
VRLGVSGGLLAAGAGSSWATFGIGLVAAIVIDIGIDWGMKLAGHDPAGEVASKVEGVLQKVKELLLDGEPQAVEAYKKLWPFTAHRDTRTEAGSRCPVIVEGERGKRFGGEL